MALGPRRQPGGAAEAAGLVRVTPGGRTRSFLAQCVCLFVQAPLWVLGVPPRTRQTGPFRPGRTDEINTQTNEHCGVARVPGRVRTARAGSDRRLFGRQEAS